MTAHMSPRTIDVLLFSFIMCGVVLAFAPAIHMLENVIYMPTFKM